LADHYCRTEGKFPFKEEWQIISKRLILEFINDGYEDNPDSDPEEAEAEARAFHEFEDYQEIMEAIIEEKYEQYLLEVEDRYEKRLEEIEAKITDLYG
jgi:hypothetical protein